MKIGENKEKKDTSKRKFAKCGENFTILHEKIPSVRIQMTGENAKFQNEFNEIRLKIQIEGKVEEKTKKTIIQRENLQNFEKISQFYTTKFPQFEFK